MSHDLEFDGWWQGDVVYCCDNCSNQEAIPFDGQDIDWSGNNTELRSRGWIITQVNKTWRDFCCEKCRNEYIRKNTK